MRHNKILIDAHKSLIFETIQTFWKKSWRTSVLFVGPLIPLFWTSSDICPWFQSQGRSLSCVLPHLCVMILLDSFLDQHLLTSWHGAWQAGLFDPHTYTPVDQHLTAWQGAWQPGLFDPHTYAHINKHWETRIWDWVCSTENTLTVRASAKTNTPQVYCNFVSLFNYLSLLI